MFGYIGPFQDELKVREEREYKGWYCGLCRTLGRKYGPAGRLALSYDCTFVALLLSGIEGGGALQPGRCPYKPLPKRMIAAPCEALDFAADLDLLLAWHKLADDWRDERKISASAGRLALAPAAKKARRQRPALAAAIEAGMRELTALERQGCRDLDGAADAFARMMRQVGEQAGLAGRQGKVLPHVLYHLGRWVYLMDAWADRGKDKKSGAYNPFLAAAAGKERARFLLDLSLNEAVGAFELLEPEAHRGLLNNILYEGCGARMAKILEGEDE